MIFKTGSYGGNNNGIKNMKKDDIILNKIISNSVPDWNAKIIPDVVGDDTLENDKAVTEVMDFWKYSAFNLHTSI